MKKISKSSIEKVRKDIINIRKESRLIAVSGYFDPVHIGHLNLFLAAKALKGRLVVIVNNDNQMKLKGRPRLMKDIDRAKIIESFEMVDYAILSIDEDRSVCKTIEKLKPDIFANGGDRFSDNIPELDVCKKLGIEMIFGVGGDKIRSSSNFIRSVQKQKFDKEINDIYKKDFGKKK